MSSQVVERRRFRRAAIPVSVELRPTGKASGSGTAEVGQVQNVSLAGVYCNVAPSCQLKPGDSVTCSISIPPDQAQQFPFTRILGNGWVVRREAIPTGRRSGEQPTGVERFGLAVAFEPDITALGSIN